VKRFSGNTTWRQILREYKALRAVKKRPHPNIVEVLSAFYYGDQDVYFNLSFSLAVGNLKQLFRGTLNGSSVAGEFETLWSQFEGLAGAVSHLHNECDIAHTDLKPSNVLLYRTGGTPPLVCKIADFGLAVELPDRSTTFESRWAWKYDAPEPRPPPELRAEMARNKPPDSSSPRYLEGPPDSKLSARGDIWKLGAIFTELSTFLVFGAKGVYDFRQRITTTRENFTSDGLSDSLFDDGMFGDGVKVKFEVLDWIRVLRQYNPFVAEIAVLLHQMFAEDYNKRPSAARLFAQLQQVS
jgi:serine/threonine protein kinase